nr:non-structural maintenance of chromosomes element 1 homolog isoform X8 [Oryctolagus cuniculus]
MGAPHSLSPRLRGGSEPAFRPSVAGARGRGVPDAFREEKGASRKARRWTEVPSQMQGSTRKAGVMTDVHRRFLQLLMTHGVLEEWDMERLQRHCYKVHDCNAPIDRLEDFINNINSVLESLYIEIKKGVTEDDGRPIYALLELIIDSETGFASSTNILNLVDQLKGKKMRKKEAEQVLQKFVQNKWLIEKEGEFTLHSRAILEMEQYIRETFPDSVKSCNICHGLLIQGQNCETCGIRMHLPCVAKYFQSNPEPRCPHCNDYWPHEVPDVFDPEKEREAGVSKPTKKSSRSRQH